MSPAAGSSSSDVSSVITGILLLIFFGLLYFAPSIAGKNKRKANAIFILNFFLGWTLIGWVVALVWAVADDEDQKATNKAPRTFHCPNCQTALAYGQPACGSCGVAMKWNETGAPLTKKCPDCAEEIRAEARKCRFCGCVFADAHSSPG